MCKCSPSACSGTGVTEVQSCALADVAICRTTETAVSSCK
jgi:hypothetical protein